MVLKWQQRDRPEGGGGKFSPLTIERFIGYLLFPTRLVSIKPVKFSLYHSSNSKKKLPYRVKYIEK